MILAFAFGCAAFGAAVAIGAATLAIVADAAGWPTFRLALGPVLLLEFIRSPSVTATTFGAGLAVVPVAGGALNALAAALLLRR